MITAAAFILLMVLIVYQQSKLNALWNRVNDHDEFLIGKKRREPLTPEEIEDRK